MVLLDMGSTVYQNTMVFIKLICIKNSSAFCQDIKYQEKKSVK